MALICSDKQTEFEQYLEAAHIRHKRIRSATPRHNGKVERVHRMDDERFYTNRTFYSLEDANAQLQRYQRWDNNFPLLVLGPDCQSKCNRRLRGKTSAGGRKPSVFRGR